MKELHFNNFNLWINKNPLNFNQDTYQNYQEFQNIVILNFTQNNQKIIFGNTSEIRINNFEVRGRGFL